eukprot:12330-Heterococcus_DN1.PRE.5
MHSTHRQHLETTRQELSQAFYQADASARVIARVVRERDEARDQLSSQRAALAVAAASAPGAAAATEEMEVDAGAAAPAADDIPAALTQAVIDDLTVVWKAKTKQRKARTIPTDLTKPDDITAWSTAAAAAHTLHKTNPAGITCLATSQVNPNLSLTGGVDKTMILFNRASGAQQAVMTGHTKKVLDVGFSLNGEFLLSSSADGTAKVWNTDGALLHTVSHHKGEVTAVAAHITNNYFVTAGRDKAWGFYDIQQGTYLRQVTGEAFEGGYECARFHPDGLILATGTNDAQIRIWDMKTQKNVASFKEHAAGSA